MDIDFIITWVDGSDPKWLKEKEQYSPSKGSDTNKARYRYWDNLQYWFRGIEKFAPWVHKIFFVTYGHYPSWLNIGNPKLKIVNHKDYIPNEWLPTFSSRTIDMNFHRIPELSEHFVYFNDDMFLTAPVSPEDFFKKGLPCDTAILNTLYVGINPNKAEFMAPIFDTIPINRHFKKSDVIKKNIGKWFSPHYGIQSFRTLLLTPWRYFTGFMNYHLPYSYLKSTYKDVWDVEGDLLAETCSHKFRQSVDLNHWVFNYWQIVTGNFSPRSPKLGKQINILGSLAPGSNEAALKAIKDNSIRIVCLNDGLPEEEFDDVKNRVNMALDKLLPNKSSFEL